MNAIVPCEGCLHSPVCVLQPQLRGALAWLDDPVVGSLDAALHVTVSIDAVCDHQLLATAQPTDTPVVSIAPVAAAAATVVSVAGIRRLPASALGPVQVTCHPGCEESFPQGIPFGEHRRTCPEYARLRATAREVPSPGPAPIEGLAEITAAADQFRARRHELAAGAARRAWDAMHERDAATSPVAVEDAGVGPVRVDGRRGQSVPCPDCSAGQFLSRAGLARHRNARHPGAPA